MTNTTPTLVAAGDEHRCPVCKGAAVLRSGRYEHPDPWFDQHCNFLVRNQSAKAEP